MTQTWLMPILTTDAMGPSLVAKMNTAAQAFRTLHAGSSDPTGTVARLPYQHEPRATEREPPNHPHSPPLPPRRSSDLARFRPVDSRAAR